MAELELKRIRKSYDAVEVIHGIDLKFAEGEFTVLVGPSGCGKSTLLRMLAGLEDVTGGSLLIDGRDATKLGPLERGVAMVFQNYALYPHLDVAKNIGFSLSIAKTPRQEIKQRVQVVAETLQIGHLLDRKPAELSGGQRQRVAIGRAIIRNPSIFLFDEPLSNLDAELRVSMRVEIGRLHQRLNATMIYVTHDQTEAMTMADKIVVLRDGVIEQNGTPKQLYSDPDNAFVAGFIGSPRMNFIPVEAQAGRLTLPDGTEMASPVQAKGSVQLGVRPEHLSLEPVVGAGASIKLLVDVTEYLGGTCYVYGTIGNGNTMIAEARGRDDLRSGDSVEFYIDPSRIYLFDHQEQRIR